MEENCFWPKDHELFYGCSVGNIKANLAGIIKYYRLSFTLQVSQTGLGPIPHPADQTPGANSIELLKQTNFLSTKIARLLYTCYCPKFHPIYIPANGIKLFFTLNNN